MASLTKCAFCSGPSTLLCDGKIYESEGTGAVRVPLEFKIPEVGKIRTCNNPVCRTCAKKIGDVHIHAKGGCRWDTRDLCPDCQAAQTSPIPVQVGQTL